MKTKASKKRFAVIGGIAAVALLAGGTIAVLSGGSDPAPKAESSKTATEPKVYQAPVNLEFWQNRQWGGPKESEVNQVIRDYVDEKIAGTDFEKTTNATAPSEEAGFTSDMGESGTKDGSINPLYSYWTDATFKAQSVLLLEAIVNPVYGGWADGQAPGAAGSISADALAGVFTDRYLSGSGNLPLMADWSGNGYGEPDIVEAGGAYWFGEVQSYDADWKWDARSQSYRVATTYKVVYRARLSDDSIVSRRGTLKLTFVPAPSQAAEEGGFRVQIDVASLRLQD